MGEERIKRLCCALATLDSVTVRTYWGGEGFWVCPKAAGGFDVSIEIEDDEFTVATDTWHDHFDDAERAIRRCVYSLTSIMRVQRTFRGSQVVRSELQGWNGFSWETTSVMGLIFVPFWRRKHIEYIKNNALTEAEAEAIIVNVLQA